MDNLKNIEVELKFPLENYEELKKQLNSIAKPEKQNDYQKDTYYIPPHRNFIREKPISEWLRIRETKNKHSINYKNWHYKDGQETNSCDEFETNIEDIDSLKKIFENLDIKEIIVVEKTRNTWVFKDVEIAIDKVTELGNFIELEAKGNFADIEDAKKHLYKILDELNAKVGEQDFKGYPYNILEKKGLLKIE